jgi:hypothetical protein
MVGVCRSVKFTGSTGVGAEPYRQSALSDQDFGLAVRDLSGTKPLH